MEKYDQLTDEQKDELDYMIGELLGFSHDFGIPLFELLERLVWS
jgi:hypothetical protein